MKFMNIITARCILAGGLIVLLLVGLYSMAHAAMSIEKQTYGSTPEGNPVDLYTLRNANGMEVQITNYEGIVVSIRVPDHEGTFNDVVLGYDTLEEYIKHDPYFGGINDRGSERFNHLVWQVSEMSANDSVGLELTTTGENIEKGRSENLVATVVYTLTDNNELQIEYTVTTDTGPPVNLTNQIFFNLAGQGSRDILEHELMINGESFYPLQENTLKPIGELRGVMGTAMDYHQPTTISPMLAQDDEQIRLGKGYNHVWQLNNRDQTLDLAARVYEPTTRRVLEVRTTVNGMWFNTGNFMDTVITGKGHKQYKRYYGFTLEAQDLSIFEKTSYFPPLIESDRAYTYTHTIIYKFFTL